ncbi:uncharacterized protein A4U43_C06F8070 [Asparagus officinalis]|uniref:Pentatricopeptide repeat-containing protein n=1 Tax=Asparagus officinalis TaxID=4686 RepID=A0A5P1EPE9_ASPOF|nr:uncharacterized protein A4U43_C06F8070 [Asparagus officinalis]
MYACFGHLGSAWKLFEGFVEEADIVTWTSMIDRSYASVGMMEKVRELFSIMPKWDVVTWNSMIDKYARDANVALARGFFDSMPKKSLVSWKYIDNHPNEVCTHSLHTYLHFGDEGLMGQLGTGDDDESTGAHAEGEY